MAVLLLYLAAVPITGSPQSHLELLLHVGDGDLSLVLVHEVVVDGLGEGVDVGGREFARADPPLEQQVQLCERAPRRLRNAEVRVDDA